MANTQALANSFKNELLTGTHDLTTGTGDTIKAALYLATATVNKSTTVYSATGEVSGTGYTAGGATVTNGTSPALDGDVAHWTPSASLSWASVTLTTAFDAVLLYNSSKTNKAIGVFTFGSTTVDGGNFTLNMPTNDGTTGLIRLS